MVALVAASSCAGSTQANGATIDFLTRDGSRLMVGSAGYRFDGLNIYNANSQGQCGEPLASGPNLNAALGAKGIGPGQEVFRAWFFQPLATVDGGRDWTAFDHTLTVARAYGARVIVVLADQWGHCDGEAARTLAWYQGGYRTQVDPGSLVPYRQWVAQAVARYAGNPTVAFWQLVTEGEARNADDSCAEALAAQALRAFADDVGGLIRSIDHHHLIGLGTIAGECGSDEADYQAIHASPAIDLCDYHDYGQPDAAMPGDQYNGLQVSITRCHALNKPIIVGETGIHTSQITPATLAERALLFQQKFSAQFAAGVAGELMWDWSADAPSGGDYEIGPSDPSLAVLRAY